VQLIWCAEHHRYEAVSTFEERAIPKDAGFRWDKELGAWRRRISESDAPAFLAELPFPAWLGTEPMVILVAEPEIGENEPVREALFRFDREVERWTRAVPERIAAETLAGLPFLAWREDDPPREVELVGLHPRSQNDAAKAAGFRWDPERKLWARRIREPLLADFLEGLPFRVRTEAL